MIGTLPEIQFHFGILVKDPYPYIRGFEFQDFSSKFICHRIANILNKFRTSQNDDKTNDNRYLSTIQSFN